MLSLQVNRTLSARKGKRVLSDQFSRAINSKRDDDIGVGQPVIQLIHHNARNAGHVRPIRENSVIVSAQNQPMGKPARDTVALCNLPTADIADHAQIRDAFAPRLRGFEQRHLERWMGQVGEAFAVGLVASG